MRRGACTTQITAKVTRFSPLSFEIEAPSVLTTRLLATITFSEIRFLQGSSRILVGAGSLALQFRLRLNSESDLDLYLRLGELGCIQV